MNNQDKFSEKTSSKLKALLSPKALEEDKFLVCHPTVILSKNNCVVKSTCEAEQWSQFDLRSRYVHFSTFILNRFGNLSRCVRVLFVVLHFTRKLLLSVRKNLHTPIKRDGSTHFGKCNFLLSFEISRLMCKLNLTSTETNENRLIARKHDYDIAFFTFLKELQYFVIPELVLELNPNKYRSDLTHFKNLIVFLDSKGYIKKFKSCGSFFSVDKLGICNKS